MDWRALVKDAFSRSPRSGQYLLLRFKIKDFLGRGKTTKQQTDFSSCSKQQKIGDTKETFKLGIFSVFVFVWQKKDQPTPVFFFLVHSFDSAFSRLLYGKFFLTRLYLGPPILSRPGQSQGLLYKQPRDSLLGESAFSSHSFTAKPWLNGWETLCLPYAGYLFSKIL